MSEMLDVATKAALCGAREVRRLFGKDIRRLGAKYKPDDGDSLQTRIDTSTEKAIITTIKKSGFSGDTIRAEESGVSPGASGRVWYIDPFDGTVNIPINLPTSTIGISVRENGKMLAGVILNPFEMEIVYAESGKGAWYAPLGVEAGGFFISGNPKRLRLHSVESTKTRFAWVDGTWNEHNSARKAGWLSEVRRIAMNVREGGSNIDKPAKLARGKGHIQLTDCVGGFHDLGPGIVIMNELGGRYVDLNGEEPRPEPLTQLVIGCVDLKVFDQLLELTNKYYGPRSESGPYWGFRG